MKKHFHFIQFTFKIIVDMSEEEMGTIFMSIQLLYSVVVVISIIAYTFLLSQSCQSGITAAD